MVLQKVNHILLNPCQLLFDLSNIHHHPLSKVELADVIHEVVLHCLRIAGEGIHQLPHLLVPRVQPQAGLQLHYDQTLEVDLFCADKLLPKGTVLHETITMRAVHPLLLLINLLRERTVEELKVQQR
jgi:hypothetical protein